jgi:hypothetical protein
VLTVNGFNDVLTISDISDRSTNEDTHLALLRFVDVRVADLDGLRLGQAFGNTITLDVNAAGHGWFLDPTPQDNSEFHSVNPPSEIRNPQSPALLLAAGDSAAAGHMDLLTVVPHELGHVLGLADDYSDPTSADLMTGWLDVGLRRRRVPSVHGLIAYGIPVRGSASAA